MSDVETTEERQVEQAEASDVEKAKLYVQLAKEKFEGIQKRRQTAWRTNFVLWAALGVLIGVLYREAGLLPENARLYIWLGFGVVFLMHAWHWIGAYVSDEKGYSWAHYYQDKAEKWVESTIAVRKRPAEGEGWRYHLLTKHPNWRAALTKGHAILPQIAVTLALMAIAVSLVQSRVSKASNAASATPPPATSRPAS